MAYSQVDLDDLQSNIAKGVTTCMIQGEMVVFRSLGEMERLEQKLKRELGQSTGKVRAHMPATTTGFR